MRSVLDLTIFGGAGKKSRSARRSSPRPRPSSASERGSALLRDGSDADLGKELNDLAEGAPKWGRKVFISDVADAFAKKYGLSNSEALAQIKQRLPRLNQNNHVEATRADLVAMMPMDKVRASQINGGYGQRGAELHFIVPKGKSRS